MRIRHKSDKRVQGREGIIPAGIAIAGCGLFFTALFVVVVILTHAVMFIWNLFVPSAFGGPTIGVPEAFGLLAFIWLVGLFFRQG